MSGLLAGKVWLSNLRPQLKPLAATLADIANDDGTSIYPSVAYIAWRLGSSERSVQRGLSDLISLGAL
ncbi:MAG: helix-turn-helix domain-containing protein [Terracidiphilus sp.]